MRKPCTLNRSLRQWTLTAFPHDGAIAALACVSCVQCPTGPAHTSGGAARDSRTRATSRPVSAADTSGSPRPERVVIVSSPCQSDVIAPVAALTAAISDPPCDHMVASIACGPCHRNAATDTVALGVRSRGVPPAAGTVYRSPPVDPWSLITPPMNAICDPSGDQRGSAICTAGLAIWRTAPDAASMASTRATHQLLFPEPVAALTTSSLPLGDQSNS